MTVLVSLIAGFVLMSPAFSRGAAMPSPYTCDGTDVSPPLRWSDPPLGTRSFSLVLVDLDTRPPKFVHWYLTAIPSSSRGLTAATAVGRQHPNDFGRSGYGGPCPPAGETHRYLFQVTALDRRGRPLALAHLLAVYRRR